MTVAQRGMGVRESGCYRLNTLSKNKDLTNKKTGFCSLSIISNILFLKNLKGNILGTLLKKINPPHKFKGR